MELNVHQVMNFIYYNIHEGVILNKTRNIIKRE